MREKVEERTVFLRHFLTVVRGCTQSMRVSAGACGQRPPMVTSSIRGGFLEESASLQVSRKVVPGILSVPGAKWVRKTLRMGVNAGRKPPSLWSSGDEFSTQAPFAACFQDTDPW